MLQTTIEFLLEEKIGLCPESVGSENIAKAIRHRMRACGLSPGEEAETAYLSRLRSSDREWDQLADEVLVPETWFFRNQASFTYFESYVRFEWLPQNKNRVLRVLCIPCSTGEEAYSIAIALTNISSAEDISPRRFHIDAADISVRSLQKAKIGVYGQESFRGGEHSFQEHYFEQERDTRGNKDVFRVIPGLRNMVRFVRGNLADSRLLLEEKPYDIIFCRNLLIYLSGTAKKQALEVIDRLLARDGILFVGHVERSLVIERPPRFPELRPPEPSDKTSEACTLCMEPVITGQPGVFACRRSPSVLRADSQTRFPTVPEQDAAHNPPSETPAPIRKTAVSALKNRFPRVFRRTRENSTAASPGVLSAGAGNADTGALLETAREMADRGFLDQAFRLCEKYLVKDPFHAQPHFLMGLICNAMGNEEKAEAYFNKTVYLDPAHYEALSHLALIMERRGEQDRAVHLIHRAQRILEREGEAF